MDSWEVWLHSFHPKLHCSRRRQRWRARGARGARGAACALQELGCSRLVGESGRGGESHGGLTGRKERPVDVSMSH